MFLCRLCRYIKRIKETEILEPNIQSAAHTKNGKSDFIQRDSLSECQAN